MTRWTARSVIGALALSTGAIPAYATGPVTPTVTVAVAYAPTAAVIVWSDPNVGEDGYELQRSLTETRAYTTVARVAGTAAVDTGLTPNTTYYYRVRAYRGRSRSDFSARVSIRTPLLQANRAPIAQAGADRGGLRGAAIAFSGSASSDPDGDPLVYDWTFGDGATFRGVTTTHAYATAGTFTASLTVTDPSGARGTDTALMTISNPPPVNRSPIAQAGADRSGLRSSAIAFNGSASSDPDGDPLVYDWTFGDGATFRGVATTHAYATAGTFTATLTVTDPSGVTGSDSAVVTVTNPSVDLTPPNPPGPLVVTSLSCANASLRWGAATDNVGGSGVATYEVTRNGAIVATIAAPATTGSDVTVGRAPSTSYSYTVVAIDQAGNRSPATTTLLNVACQHRWGMHFGDTLNRSFASAATKSTAIDSNGNIIVSGVFQGTVSLGGASYDAGPSAGGSFPTRTVIAKLGASTGTPLWVRTEAVQPGQNVDYRTTETTEIAVDLHPNCDGLGGTDCIIAASNQLEKFSANGNLLWSTSTLPPVVGLAVDASGNSVVAGYFTSSLNLGTNCSASVGAGLSAYFVAKYSDAGTCLWLRNAVPSLGTSIAYRAVAIDPNGEIVVGGSVTGHAQIVAGTFVDELHPFNGFSYSDLLLARFSSTGAFMRANVYGGSGYDRIASIGIDANGDVSVLASLDATRGDVDLGGGVVTTADRLSGRVVVARYSRSGVLRWAHVSSGLGNHVGTGIAVDSAGKVAVAGWITGALSLGGNTMSSFGSQGDVFVMKFSPSGQPSWKMQYGTPLGIDVATAITVGPAGTLAVTGHMEESSADFGFGPWTSAISGDAFVIAYGPE